jgi:hypothetical protein
MLLVLSVLIDYLKKHFGHKAFEEWEKIKSIESNKKCRVTLKKLSVQIIFLIVKKKEKTKSSLLIVLRKKCRVTLKNSVFK